MLKNAVFKNGSAQIHIMRIKYVRIKHLHRTKLKGGQYENQRKLSGVEDVLFYLKSRSSLRE